MACGSLLFATALAEASIADVLDSRRHRLAVQKRKTEVDAQIAPIAELGAEVGVDTLDALGD